MKASPGLAPTTRIVVPASPAHRRPLDRRVGNVDERPRRGVDPLAVERERPAAGEHDVQLLVRLAARLVVLADDLPPSSVAVQALTPNDATPSVRRIVCHRAWPGIAGVASRSSVVTP
jgi:hypothetical protein